jgi:hypothetical protein
LRIRDDPAERSAAIPRKKNRGSRGSVSVLGDVRRSVATRRFAGSNSTQKMADKALSDLHNDTRLNEIPFDMD